MLLNLNLDLHKYGSILMFKHRHQVQHFMLYQSPSSLLGIISYTSDSRPFVMLYIEEFSPQTEAAISVKKKIPVLSSEYVLISFSLTYLFLII